MDVPGFFVLEDPKVRADGCLNISLIIVSIRDQRDFNSHMKIPPINNVKTWIAETSTGLAVLNVSRCVEREGFDRLGGYGKY